MKKSLLSALLLAGLSPALAAIDLGDMAKQVLQQQTQATQGGATTQPQTVLGAGLAESDMAAGLKQALSKGTQYAVSTLGQDGGFLNNPAVKIPMPASLNLLETGLRKIGQGKWADDFIAALNQAAEKAVPEAAAVFSASIEAMSIDDAQQILNGGENAATQYFQTTNTAELQARFLPIVQQATEAAGVTKAYKALQAQSKGLNLGALGGLLGGANPADIDLDAYVTDKSLDGLFKLIAEQEQKIRGQVSARDTDLLKKVFGGS